MADLPAPLTPPDCDLRGMPYMPLEVVRLRDSDFVALSTGPQFKAAVLLWCYAWGQLPAASLPDDDRILARVAGCSLPRWRTLKPMALRGWIKCDDGRLYHPVIAEKARIAWEARKLQRAKARKRWSRSDSDEDEQQAMSEPGRESLPQQRSTDAAAMQGRGRVKGRGRGTHSVSKETAAVDATSRNAGAWRRGVAALTASGSCSATEARTFFGQLLREHALSAGDLLEPVTRCEQSGSPDPKAYLKRAAQKIAQDKAEGERTTSPEHIVSNWDADEWRVALEEREATGRWPRGIGPEPGEPGCLTPATILEAFEGRARARSSP